MSKVVLLSLVVALFIFSCGKDETRLEKDSPAYNFAKKIADKVPYFDPDANNIIVTTRDFKITTGEVLGSIYKTAGKRTSQFYNLDSTVLKEILRNNTQQYAEKTLLLHAMKKDGFDIPPSKMDSLLEQQYRRHGGQEKFMESVQRMGVDKEAVVQQMMEGLRIENYLNKKLEEKVNLSDEELFQVYNEDKTATVRHILLNTQGKSDAEKEKIRGEMEGILERARAGEDFALLANEYSEDPGSKDKGGLYENFARGVMVKPFEEAAFSVPVGEVSDIVETQFGYHILKVENRKKEDKPFEEVKEQLRSKAEQLNRNTVYFEFMDELRESAEYQMVEF
ncbi:MAG: peptidylprolyl isomerase [bacterium]|nr:MAG: peptidylprolyl isomerase [bacterium]